MKSVFRVSCCLGFACLLLAHPLSAGTTGKISGKVLDQQTKEPLFGANVVIHGTNLGASTNAKGEYYILNVHPGTYAVVISYIGYENLTQTQVAVHADRTTYLNAALKPTLIEGEAVTVIAERPVIEPDLTSSEQLVTAKAIEKSWTRTVKEVWTHKPA